jgi:predicted Zn-dependent protease
MAGCTSFERDPSQSLNLYYTLLKQTEANLNNPPDSMPDQDEPKARDIMFREQVELFGLMPAADNFVAKFIMLSFEICRVHMYTRKPGDEKDPNK